LHFLKVNKIACPNGSHGKDFESAKLYFTLKSQDFVRKNIANQKHLIERIDVISGPDCVIKSNTNLRYDTFTFTAGNNVENLGSTLWFSDIYV